MKKIVKTNAGIGNYYWDWIEFKYLVAVLKQAKDFKDILNIFIDIHTQKEISEIIRRVIIASLFLEGKTYDEIQQLTGCSRSTLVKINTKIMRKKAVISTAIKNTGTFEKFRFNEEKMDTRDSLSRLIDNTLAKRDVFGMFSRKK